MPQRAEWDRIVVVTPHYRGFERAGLGSKLHGVGIFVQDLNDGRVKKAALGKVSTTSSNPMERLASNAEVAISLSTITRSFSFLMRRRCK